jgi:hypothetical protein
VGENGLVILPKLHLFTPFKNLLHAANLRHGANGFTSLPKEGMLKIFSPDKSDGFGRENKKVYSLDTCSYVSHKDRYYHFPKYWPFFLDHLVY